MVSGADEDIEKANAAFQEFFESKPYEQIIARYPHSWTDIHKLRFKKMPLVLGRNISKVGADLRSALDHVGYDCAALSGNTRLKYTHFPFGASESHLDDVIRGKCKDLPKDIVSHFRSFKPYRGGDDLLWAINEIANGIKHRGIKPLAYEIGPTRLRKFNTGGSSRFAFAPKWSGGKYEIELAHTSLGANPTYEFELAFRVAFDDVPIVDGADVVTTLQHMSAKVTGIIDSTEAKVRLLGLIP